MNNKSTFMFDDYLMMIFNQKEKQAHQNKKNQAEEIRKRLSVSIPLLPENRLDIEKAKSVQFEKKKQKKKNITPAAFSKLLQRKKE